MKQNHTIPLFIKEDSKILILGSFPSVKSRESGFYYGHEQNRFWRVVAELSKKPLPVTIEDKKKLLTDSKIALWDVVQSCDIVGSSDSSIKNVTPNDIDALLKESNINSVYVNGHTAERLYNKYIFQKTGVVATVLPSTSPANAAWSVERLKEEWAIIFSGLQSL